jgi:hypothetical protein
MSIQTMRSHHETIMVSKLGFAHLPSPLQLLPELTFSLQRWIAAATTPPRPPSRAPPSWGASETKKPTAIKASSAADMAANFWASSHWYASLPVPKSENLGSKFKTSERGSVFRGSSLSWGPIELSRKL